MLTSHAHSHDTADRGFTVPMIIQRDSTDLIAWIKKLGIHPTGHGKQKELQTTAQKSTKVIYIAMVVKALQELLNSSFV